MYKITTNWKKIKVPADTQVTPQHFIDIAHYREYELIMLKRGYQGELVEVLNLDTNEKANIGALNEIIFGGNDV